MMFQLISDGVKINIWNISNWRSMNNAVNFHLGKNAGYLLWLMHLLDCGDRGSNVVVGDEWEYIFIRYS